MKRDIAATIAVGVAIMVMAVCVIVGFAGPVRAEEDPNVTAAKQHAEDGLNLVQRATSALQANDWGMTLSMFRFEDDTRDVLLRTWISETPVIVRDGRHDGAPRRTDTGQGNCVCWTDGQGGSACATYYMGSWRLDQVAVPERGVMLLARP